MTSKLVVNTIEADTGISSVSFASSISMNSTAKFHFSAAGVDIGADTNINRPAAGALGFNINSSEKVRILSGGVGIGITNPDRQFEVNANSANTFIRIKSSDTGNAGIEFGDQSDTVQGAIFQNSSDNSVRFNGYNNAERFRIDSSGRLLVGQTSAINGIFGSPPPRFSVSTSTASPAIFATFSNDTYGSRIDILKSRNATVGSHTVVQANDALGEIYFGGSDGDQFHGGALIQAVVESGVGNDDMPTNLRFYTNGGATTVTERLRIGSDGKVDVVGGYIARNPSDSFTLNGVNTPHYGFQLNASSTVPIAMAGYYGIAFATTGVERLRIKKTTGEVGIGDGDPQSTLVVRKDNQTGRGGEISIVNYAGGGASGIGNEAALNFGLENSTYHADNGNAQIKALITAANHSTDMVFSVYTGSGFQESLRINSAGAVTKPYQYMFTVETNGTSKTANWSKITGLTPDSAQCTGVSDGTNWSNSTDRFTAPVAGIYHFFVGGWAVSSNNGSRYAYTFKHTNGNNYKYIGGGNYCLVDSPMDGFSRTIKLSAGEWVELWGYSSVATTWGGSHRFFWGGYLLG